MESKYRRIANYTLILKDAISVERSFGTQRYSVEKIGNATEDTIRKYVQNQLIKLGKNSDKNKVFEKGDFNG